MTLKYEEREAIVTLRLDKAKETLKEAIANFNMDYWHTAANRLYYACYYAASALLIKKGIEAKTHSGVINMFGLHFVTTGIIDTDEGKLYKRMFELRQTGDYDDWIVLEKEDIEPLIEPVKNFLGKIVLLTQENS